MNFHFFLKEQKHSSIQFVDIYSMFYNKPQTLC